MKIQKVSRFQICNQVGQNSVLCEDKGPTKDQIVPVRDTEDPTCFGKFKAARVLTYSFFTRGHDEHWGRCRHGLREGNAA